MPHLTPDCARRSMHDLTVSDMNLTRSDTRAMRTQSSRHADAPIRSIGALLIPDFALIAYSCALEPFRAANRLSGRDLYVWNHVSPDGRPVRASNGVHIVPDVAIGAEAAFDLVLVCAGGNPTVFDHVPTLSWLRRIARAGTRIAGISGGPYIMAKAGILDGYRCTSHWEYEPAMREAFPSLDVTGRLYEIDRGRLSCSGGTAALDMMHAVIERDHGHELASDVVEWFIHTSLRPSDGSQRLPVRERFAVGHPKLVRVLEVMEGNLDDPVRNARLAEIAGVSTRQLERLFRTHLKRSIGQHYKELRLRRARILLAQSTMSVLDVAVSCGFVSASHFSRAYRARFGHPPRQDRRPTVNRHRTDEAHARMSSPGKKASPPAKSRPRLARR